MTLFPIPLFPIRGGLRSATAAKNALLKDGVPNTGVAALDARAIESSSFAQKMAAMERAGFKVTPDFEFAARGQFSLGEFRYNPNTMTRLDLAHEWRHFKQLVRVQGRRIKLNSQAFRAMQGPGETGAYGLESRLWQRAGLAPSKEYLRWHAQRIQDFEPQLRSFNSMAAKPYGQKWRGINW